jgi:hypothetical protein
MEDFFAGHSHGPTPHLIDGCPLCDHLKAARNQAIEHLSEALHLLAGLRPETDRPTLRLNIAPIDLTAHDTGRCHSIDLSAKQAEALSDAIDSMNAYAGSEPPAALPQTMGGVDGEAIGVGEWSAAAVAQLDADMWDEVNDVFADLDLRVFTKSVLDDATADNLAVNRALDSFFGEIADPYADEDDA